MKTIRVKAIIPIIELGMTKAEAWGELITGPQAIKGLILHAGTKDGSFSSLILSKVRTVAAMKEIAPKRILKIENAFVVFILMQVNLSTEVI